MKQFPFFTAFTFFLMTAPLIFAQQSEPHSPSKKKPPIAEKIHLDGVSDAGKINAHLYRGSQPSQQGVESLRKQGVTTIIDLRGEFHKQSAGEQKHAESLGMKFVLIPGDGWSNPSDKQLAEFFNTLAQQPPQTVFVHCWHGEDRTGVFIAAYRIAFDHWTAEQAVAEMHAFHFNSFFHPNMESYVKHFPAHLAASKELAAYGNLTPSATVPATSGH